MRLSSVGIVFPASLLVLVLVLLPSPAFTMEVAVDAAAGGEGGVVPTAGVLEPIQLLRPDAATHTKLELNEDALEVLARVPTPLRVLAVVGPYHSGKSFLMNRLTNQPGKGFEVGDSVDPTTHGMWAAASFGSDEDLLVIDTEGFAAADSTSDYDAKMFTVATMVSTALLYNSLHLITQADVEFADVLARRAKLFHLRMAAQHAHFDLPSDEFPPLLWLVQGFSQKLVDEETPTQWLQRLLSSAHRSSGVTSGDGTGVVVSAPTNATALSTIFGSVECQTLGYPVSAVADLLELSRLPTDRLARDYVSALESLRRDVWATLSTSSVPVMTGAELANTLRLLVDAVNNSKMMTAVPSSWNLFVKQQLSEASQTAADLFDAQLARVLNTRPPVSLDAFTDATTASGDRAERSFGHLSLGLPPADVARALSQLQDRVTKLAATSGARYAADVADYCDGSGATVRDEFNSFVAQLDLPIPSAQLPDVLEGEQSRLLAAFKADLEVYGAAAGPSIASLTEGLALAAERRTRENHDTLRQVFLGAKDAALTEYTDYVKRQWVALTQETHPLPDGRMDSLHDEAVTRAQALFTSSCGVAVDEPEYFTYLDSIPAGANRAPIDVLNAALFRKICDNVTDTVRAFAAERRDAMRPTLPRNPADLNKMLADIRSAISTRLSDALPEFLGTPGFSAVAADLEEYAVVITSDLVDANVVAMKELLHRPLKRAKQRVEDVAGSYWLRAGVRARALVVAREEIDQETSTRASSINALVVHDAIVKWVDTDAEPIIQSSGGILSWILRLFGLD